MSKTTEKTISKKGKAFTYRPYEWIDEACDHVAEQDAEATGLNIEPKHIKEAIFNAGVEPFFKSRNLPTTKEGWEALLREAVAEIQE